ncbi:hypothetical protein ACFL3F_00860 [Planctomycetota bacterium]
MKTRMLLLVLLAAVEIGAAPRDYTYSCWINGWRKNVNDRSANIFAIETNHYGFSLDVNDFSRVGLARLNRPGGYEQALNRKAESLNTLAAAELLIELEVDGVSYRVKTCKAGQRQDVKRLSSARQWESGRYVQHYDFLGLDFKNAQGQTLTCDARLDLVAWPDSLTFNLNVSPSATWSDAVLRLILKCQLGNWSQDLKVDGPWTSGQEKSLSMTCPMVSAYKSPSAEVAVTSQGGLDIAVRFDASKNCYVASANRLRRNGKTGYDEIRNYDDFKITVKGSGKGVPFLLDMRPPANITGLCPILCDAKGRPTGIPVQLSKNWHYKPMGSYLMAYTLLPAEKTTTYILRLVYGFYGTLPSASHAQLSLVGYSDKGGNGRWDQLAIGCWGETICFDMDMSLVDVAITDIRMLMARNGLEGRKWGWTNAGWGGDWLNIQDNDQAKYFQNHLKTAYLSQGPCLTDVKHDGYYGANQEIDFTAQIQTLRTDDYCRTFQKLSYTFTRDVLAEKIWLYKLGRTHNYQTPRIAYGNIDGLLKAQDVSDSLKQGELFLDPVELTGPGPYWAAFVGASETVTGRAKPNGYRALIVREYKAVIGGKTYTQPTISAPVFKDNPTNLDIELLPPAGIHQFRKGDSIELDLELITLPRVANDYYGPNESFRKHLTQNPNSWKTTYREAKGNDLSVTVLGGKKLDNYPVVIQAQRPEVTVTIKGGVGAVPIRFEGLGDNQGYQLYRVADGKRVKFDQSVHGNDFWQTDYDAATGTYKMSFNLPLDELDESQWILSKE